MTTFNSFFKAMRVPVTGLLYHLWICLRDFLSQYNFKEKTVQLFPSLNLYHPKVLIIFRKKLFIGKFELNPEAAEFLQSLEGIKLGVVAVCGKYRTGKSYLLNKLFVETYFQNLNNTSMTGSNNSNNNNNSSPKKKF